LENLTRLETFGTDDVHWVRVSVDPRYDQVFTVRQEMVEANLVDQTP
jgi:cytochrome oxidase Cu insertion factor (SCO1/SenC/PrrC family)